jgi:hypothetical protein
MERALELRTDVSGNAFRATITGVTTDKRVEDGERIKEALGGTRQQFGQTIGIGSVAGNSHGRNFQVTDSKGVDLKRVGGAYDPLSTPALLRDRVSLRAA